MTARSSFAALLVGVLALVPGSSAVSAQLADTRTGIGVVSAAVFGPAVEVVKDPELQQASMGSDITFTITVVNKGDAPLVNIVVRDPQVPGCDAAIANLAVGASISYDCTLANVTASLTNRVTAVAEDAQGHVVTDSDTALVVVAPAPVDVLLQPAQGLWIVYYPLELTAGFSAFDLLQTLSAAAVERICTFVNESYLCAENPAAPQGEDFALLAGRGVFAEVGPGGNPIRLRGATRCETSDLDAGVNVAGLPCIPAGYSSFDWLQALGDTKVSAIQRFDPLTGRFETAAFENGQPTGTDFPIRAAEGYLLQMKVPVFGFEP